MIRRIGAKNWSRLHRAVYLIGTLVVLHFRWMKGGKHDLFKPISFSALLALMLGAHIARAFRARRQGRIKMAMQENRRSDTKGESQGRSRAPAKS